MVGEWCTENNSAAESFENYTITGRASYGCSQNLTYNLTPNTDPCLDNRSKYSTVKNGIAEPGNTSFSVAPMMEITDRHCRSFHRELTSKAVLYTEMITAAAIVHGDRSHLLDFNQSEHPVVLQLGGSDTRLMTESAVIGEQYGYGEVNINCGCPSDRVKSGRFGACLMAEPELVAACVTAMQSAVNIPVTVKCRIGIDRDDSFEPFERFIDVVANAGCDTFVVHARKAWLDGLSPKENRNVPPLRYEYVEQIKGLYPDKQFVLNGGLLSHDQALACGQSLDGVMLGREVCSNPWLLSQVDHLYYGDDENSRTRYQVVEACYPYIEAQLGNGVPLGKLLKPMLGLFHAQPGGRLWRRMLSETMWTEGAGLHTLQKALSVVRQTADEVNSKSLAAGSKTVDENARVSGNG